jgi:serine/threonine protein kinase/Tol biopolymer transport system component
MRMVLTSGTRLGPYEILSPLGAGGMGEVYRAKDTRLDRLVAVKVVLGHVAANAEFRERFDREAKAISALDHPHICTLYDVGHEGELDFLVMQFLEGETLADRLARGSRPTSDPTRATTDPASGLAPDVAAARLKPRPTETAITTISTMSRGPLPLDVALRYAAEIASALDAAHRRSIVHRDLKPGNVMLTKSGTKLLDFGLAKLAEQSPVGGFGDMATRTSPLTGQGALLGTLHYMSPEQLEGREVDSRSDIFAFGALLFEMLSGHRAFDPVSPSGQGASPASVIAAIIGSEPPALGELADVKARLPLVAHAALERLLKKCLAKNPDDRWQSAADLSDELRWINEERLRAAVPTDAPVGAIAPAAPASRGRERAWMGVAGVAAVSAIALAAWSWPHPVPPPEPISFFVEAPDGSEFAGGPGLMAISPDGQQVVFATGNAANRKLWIRPLGSLAASPLTGTEQGFHPVWSPDSQSILYTIGGSGAGLKRVDLAGGHTTTIAEAATDRAAWSSSGVILYTGVRPDGRLFSVPERGGPSTPVTELDKERQEVNHLWPMFLPDGRRFVYLARSNDRSPALYLASLDVPGRAHLVDVQSMAEYVPGFLLYQRDGTLFAHPFDVDAGRLTGDPMPVLEDVIFNVGSGRAAFSASSTGTIVYRSAARPERVSALTWFDRTGKPVGQLGEHADYFRGALSPDGRRFVVAKWDGKVPNRTDLFMLDVDRGVPTRFTSGAADERQPVWTPDNESVVFTSNRKGVFDLYVKPAGGASGERLLYESANTKQPTSISADGKTLLFTLGSAPNARLWKLNMTGDPKPEQVFPGSTDDEGGAQFSPDGQWIAYTIAEGAQNTNVFVQRHPSNGIKTRVSTPTGSHPRWTSDGTHIVYQTADNIFMSAAVAPDGDRMRADLPKALFTMRQTQEGRTSAFAIDKNAERFLLVVNPRLLAEDRPEPPPLTVIVNWAQTLVKR